MPMTYVVSAQPIILTNFQSNFEAYAGLCGVSKQNIFLAFKAFKSAIPKIQTLSEFSSHCLGKRETQKISNNNFGLCPE